VLGSLSAEGAREYFADLAVQNRRIEQAALTKDDCEYIYPVMEGKPLRVAFMSTLIATKGLPPQKLLEGMDPETVDESLIWEMQRLTEDMNVALPFVAWMRKGIDSRLLQKLLEDVAGKKWGVNKCGRVLKYLKSLPFVKTRPRSPLVFLHDEMYDLMDKYVLSGSDYALDKAEVCRVTDGYYVEKIDKAKGRKRQELMVERLYYQLLANPMQGFNQYRTLSDKAIIAHEVGFDMSLRNEMLRFFEQQGPRAQEQVARDSAIRWVKRFLAMGEYKKAREVAERIWAHAKLPFLRTGDDPYFTAALQLCHGEALAYLGEEEQAIKLLREAIEWLTPASPRNGYQERSGTYILGRAHNDIGYAYARRKQYTKATTGYSEALEYFEEVGFADEMANTLKNMAFIYSQQGRIREAADLCRHARRLYQEKGLRHGEALALNTEGIIAIQSDQPDAARALCEEALRMFTDLKDARGMGLARIVLGHALRRLGWRSPHLREALKHFRQAEGYLKRANETFKDEVIEPARLMEVYNQLGRTYRDWANFYHEHELGETDEVERLEVLAEDNLKECLKRAKEYDLLAEQADTMEDIAEIHFNHRDYKRAKGLLSQSDLLIPTEYHFVKGAGIPAIREPVPIYWQILGKNSILYGRMAFAQREYDEAIENCLLAYAYFELFSGREPIVESIASDRIYNQLVSLPLEALRELEQYTRSVAEEYGVQDRVGTKELLNLIDTASDIVQTAYRGKGRVE
jgi:tetratricopeptide (TPR) repeat protein